ncbi:MAG: hypothetical protein ACK4SX_10300 [Alcanivoracaceae bacterium]
MRFFPARPLRIMLLTLALGSTPALLHAAEGTVIISRNCDYVLLDSPQGQILIKIIRGERPKAGDRLSGNLERGFSDLTNRRTGDVMQVWVDLVDRGGTRALMRYGQYCN